MDYPSPMPTSLVLYRLLLLGNSYTQANDLDLRVDALLEEGQPAWAPVDTARLADGGLTLVDHLDRATTSGTAWYEALSGSQTWTWVLLQDQSQVPGFPQTEPTWVASRDAALALDDLVEARGGQTWFLLTWGRRDGDSTNPEIYPDYLTMQAALEEGYRAYQSATSTPERPTWIAPAGPAFRVVYQSVLDGGGDPLDRESRFYALYQSDGSHPSPHGTYLVACVLYASLTGASPLGLGAPAEVAADATWLQEAAWSAVSDTSLGYTYPWSGGGETGIPDTGAPDSGTLDSASETGDPADTGTSGTVDSGDEGEPKGPCGCGTGAGAGSLGLGLAGILLGWRRRREGHSSVGAPR